MVLEILEKKILDFGIFSEILNFLKILKIMSYNFQSRKQILTLRGVYWSIKVFISALRIFVLRVKLFVEKRISICTALNCGWLAYWGDFLPSPAAPPCIQPSPSSAEI